MEFIGHSIHNKWNSRLGMGNDHSALLGTHIYMTAKTGIYPAFYHYKGIMDCLWKKIRRNIFIIWIQKMTHSAVPVVNDKQVKTS